MGRDIEPAISASQAAANAEQDAEIEEELDWQLRQMIADQVIVSHGRWNYQRTADWIRRWLIDNAEYRPE